MGKEMNAASPFGVVLSMVLLIPTSSQADQLKSVMTAPSETRDDSALEVKLSEETRKNSEFYLGVAYAGLVALVPEKSGRQSTTLTALLSTGRNRDHCPFLRIPKKYFPENACPVLTGFPVNQQFKSKVDCLWGIQEIGVSVKGDPATFSTSSSKNRPRRRIFPKNQAEASNSSWIAKLQTVSSHYCRADKKESLLERGKIFGYSVLPYESISTCHLSQEKDKPIYSYRFSDGEGDGPISRQALADVVRSEVKMKGSKLKLCLTKTSKKKSTAECDYEISTEEISSTVEISISNLPFPPKLFPVPPNPENRPKCGGEDSAMEHFLSFYDLSRVRSGMDVRREPRLVKPKDNRPKTLQPNCPSPYADPCDPRFTPCLISACPVLIMEPN